jgi:predicted ATPase
MATLDAIRVKNLRSLRDTDWVEQRLITVLVGKNSAGKSTYARMFPLLRQSATSKRSSPILWFGQFVDFGQFSNAVHNQDMSKSIELAFKLGIVPEEIEGDYFDFSHGATSRGRVAVKRFEVEVSIQLRSGNQEEAADTVAQCLSLSSEGLRADLLFDDGGLLEEVRVDGTRAWRSGQGEICRVTYESALPTLRFLKEKKEESAESKESVIYYESFDPFSKQLIQEVRSHVHGNLGEDRIHELASRLAFGGEEYFYQRSLNAGALSKSWIEYFQGARRHPELLKSLKRAVFTAKLPSLIFALNRQLTRQFGAVRYIEPLRATAQRYYRKQDLAIDELDPKGGNVAQYLQGLSASKKASFDRLSRKLFGFTVQPKVQAGHIELLLEQEGDKQLVNLADAGVGFSQMLPILLQVWGAIGEGAIQNTRIRGTQDAYLIVEQPELHLHPAYQAALADLFCEVAVGDGMRRRGRVIIETHSPALVNRLGTLISEKRLEANDVQILLFDQNIDERVTHVRQATFDSSGELNNWPFGFFEPEV